MTDKPWTFQPFEMEAESRWVIYDDNEARIVAVFHVEDEASAYLKWRNKRQEKLARKAEKDRAADALRSAWRWRAAWTLAEPVDNPDDDGRC